MSKLLYLTLKAFEISAYNQGRRVSKKNTYIYTNIMGVLLLKIFMIIILLHKGPFCLWQLYVSHVNIYNSQDWTNWPNKLLICKLRKLFTLNTITYQILYSSSDLLFAILYTLKMQCKTIYYAALLPRGIVDAIILKK